jgi:hypothetical protein
MGEGFDQGAIDRHLGGWDLPSGPTVGAIEPVTPQLLGSIGADAIRRPTWALLCRCVK